ncbi:MAG: HAMP domain-containing histidine kinase [Marinospirillum sp.]|uniref:sensor histidine kinase n=1 Tax=Marinospirillum sp. TaxID=2183934 RepID=UPI0019E4C765|nr:HAMP domain-containing sensor histidine kinase [Marinospirillum sp.]MBE0507468.1 HAMP domain-containing histidine kinase [Marinospirillum sp.]
MPAFRSPNLSLLQMVLLGFMLVLLPLAVLVFQAFNAHRDLSAQAGLTAREAVSFTRRTRALAGLALDMERTSRQYQVVQNADLLELLQSQLQGFQQLLAEPFVLFNPPEAQAVLEQLLQNPELTPDYMERLTAQTDLISLQSQQIVDRQLSQLQQEVLRLQQQLAWQFLLLAGLSFLLVLFFTWRLMRPLGYLQRRIHAIANPSTRQKARHLHEGPSELVELNEQLNWLEQQLSEIEEQKQQFLRHISHELKTPLASIREASDLLDEEVLGQLTPKQKEVTQLLGQNSRRLQQLIEQLLDYNLLQGKKQIRISSVQLNSLLQQLLEPWKPLLAQRNQALLLPASTITLYADLSLLRSALDNLISNAIHYGDPEYPIQLRAGSQPPRHWIEVENHGTPIPPDEQKRLFEPFFQGSSRRSGSVKGSGLGLSIAAECMKAQNGTLRLKPSPGNTINFRLEWIAEPTGRE